MHFPKTAQKLETSNEPPRNVSVCDDSVSKYSLAQPSFEGAVLVRIDSIGKAANPVKRKSPKPDIGKPVWKGFPSLALGFRASSRKER